MSLQNVLRGRLAEQIFTILLERAGYRVTRLGIEVLFDEVKYLDRERYLALGPRSNSDPSLISWLPTRE